MEVESLDHKIRAQPSRAGPKLLSAPTPEGSGPMAGPKTPRWPHKIGKLGSWGAELQGCATPTQGPAAAKIPSFVVQPAAIGIGGYQLRQWSGRYAAAFFPGPTAFPIIEPQFRSPFSSPSLFFPAGPACAKHKMASDGSSTVTLDRDYFDLLVRRYVMNTPPQTLPTLPPPELPLT